MAAIACFSWANVGALPSTARMCGTEPSGCDRGGVSHSERASSSAMRELAAETAARVRATWLRTSGESRMPSDLICAARTAVDDAAVLSEAPTGGCSAMCVASAGAAGGPGAGPPRLLRLASSGSTAAAVRLIARLLASTRSLASAAGLRVNRALATSPADASGCLGGMCGRSVRGGSGSSLGGA